MGPLACDQVNKVRKNNVLHITEARETARKARREVARSPAAEVLTKFRQIINFNKRHFRQIEQSTGVSGTLVWVLSILRQSPGLRVSELAEIMAIHQSTASNLLDKLGEKNLVERDRSTDDQRVVRLYLTRSGEALLKRVPQPVHGLLQDALYRLPSPALQGLSRLLDQLLLAMNPRRPKGSLTDTGS